MDRVYLETKITNYYDNEPGKTYYIAIFESHENSNVLCYCQRENVSTGEVVSSYEECEKIVEKKNENFANKFRAYYSSEKLNIAEENLKGYIEVLNEAQKRAKNNWALHPNV